MAVDFLYHDNEFFGWVVCIRVNPPSNINLPLLRVVDNFRFNLQ